MNAQNTANVSLQAVLLTMLLEKIDNLTNQVRGMDATNGELKQSVDSLTARISALESSAIKAKKETEVKLDDVVDDKHEEGALEPPKEAETSSPVVEAKKEPTVKPQQGFGDKFNKKKGEWDCQTCYLRNKPSEDICVSCGMGKDGKQAPPETSSAPAFKPTTFSSPANAQYSFGINKPAPSFGIASTTTASMPAAPSPKSLFGGSTTSSANKTPLSFSSFASGTSFLGKQTTDLPNNSFGAQKSSTFGKTEEGKKENGEESENPEEYVPDAHYEPVVPLPDKVEVVTGEESEEVLFKNRAKLYIFNSDTKEVKERGVGDIKVLYNPEKKTYRVVMRREQVHKICANFRITNGMTVADKPGLKNCGVFSCVDFSENGQSGAITVFFVRFREDSAYEEFKKLFSDIATSA